jgi:GNAT superfamily N-acetyltransferase
MTAGERLAAFGLALPPGHALVSLAERPELSGPMGALNTSVWPEFMLHDGVVGALWHHLFEDFIASQCCLFDADGELVAGLNSAPLAWDGTDEDLPQGWDDQLLRSVAGLLPGASGADTLGALQIVVRPSRQGEGYAGTMVGAMRAIARSAGYRALIACVRPTHKERYPLTPIDRYATWTREDGLPLDPWIRLHVRLGGRVVRGVPASMTIRGSVAEWSDWTGLAMPESGLYLPRGAAAPVQIDVAADEGVYLDPNVWVVHDVRGPA